jgi:prefoldin subunit 5
VYSLAQKVDEGFKQVNERIDKIETRIDKIEEKLKEHSKIFERNNLH